MTKMIKRIIIEIIRDELAAKFNMRLSNLGKVKKDALLAAAKKYDIKLEKLYPIYIQNEKDEEEKERLEQEEREKKWKEEKEEKERKKEEFNNKSKEWKEKIKKLVCIDFDIKYMEQLKDWESEEQKKWRQNQFEMVKNTAPANSHITWTDGEAIEINGVKLILTTMGLFDGEKNKDWCRPTNRKETYDWNMLWDHPTTKKLGKTKKFRVRKLKIKI